MSIPPDTKLEDVKDTPAMQGVLRFLEEQGRGMSDIAAWSLILPLSDEGEFTARFTDDTGYRGTIRRQCEDFWVVWIYAVTFTTDGSPGIFTYYTPLSPFPVFF